MKAFLQKPLKVRVLRGFLLAFVLSLGAWLIPTPFHLEAPGRVFEVGAIITVDSNEVYPSRGTFLMPTVISEEATVLYCLYSLFDPEATLQRTPSSEPMAQSPNSGQGQMLRSQYFAAVVAFRALGHELPVELSGLRILQVRPDSPNQEVLKSGDLISKIEDTKLTSFRQFKRVLKEKKSGSPFPATIVRQGVESKIQLEVFRPEDRALIGVNLRPEYVRGDFPFPVRFTSGNASGASGGLVFALEIYNRLTSEDITRGRRIAATGTLDPSGQVGEIHGLEMKLKGAQRAEAQIVLVPKDNYNSLGWLPDGVEVIPVESFKQALDVLQK